MKQENLIGIDVSKNELVVACEFWDGRRERHTFANDAAGIARLAALARRGGRAAKVCLEHTGIYSFDAALGLHEAGAAVMLPNPRAVRDFQRAALVRAKTDGVDAEGNLEFLRRMPFNPWQPPPKSHRELRQLTRRILQLKEHLTQEKNHWHAAAHAPEAVRRDIRAQITSLQRSSATLEAAARRLAQADPELKRQLALLTTIKGVGVWSALCLLSELLALPADMTPSQWVAHAGLDPRPRQSGQSLDKPRRISKTGNARLRRALFCPAMVAARHNPAVKAFYDHLLGRGKKKLVALTAAMRKLLRAIWGMLHYGQPFDGSKFFTIKSPTTA
jgi:transposase